ncbi:MAG: 3-deoxy-7-phosphoheptulonate synthase [Candidatus Dormibacteraeota bacterium]|nr:3-deoxy-7-phosphoheptulonate synthase [Candidatus Dormibacteraeota bacterium]
MPDSALHDVRIEGTRPLVSPALLADVLPMSPAAQEVVLRGRRRTSAVLRGEDDHLLVVVGPCSVHDPEAGLEYARRLAALRDRLDDRLLIVMRVYFEKPRTTIGWKGLLNDPHLDGSYMVNEGLQIGRRLMLDILGLGLPVGGEFLDPISAQYFADLVSWGSIGARTAESQIHRQLSSGLSMPVGIKNGTDGEVQVAIDACAAASTQHVFTGINQDGLASIFWTRGNADCHVILRGGTRGPNYDAASVNDALERMAAAGQPARLLVDASHGNSGKDFRRQPDIVRDVVAQRAAGQRGIVGLMLESFLTEGKQDLVLGHTAGLRYGQSVTDPCLGWEETADLLCEIADQLG